MSSNEEGASDTGAPGPGVPVADVSAADGRATYDDHGMSTDYEKQTIELPLNGQIQCLWCHIEGRNQRFLQESQYLKHKDTQHPKGEIIWRCAACQKEFEKLHGCRCHLPKCKGRKEAKGVAKFKCDSCEESFLTQRGLSMHELHRHPAIRNLKRTQGTSRGNTRPTNRASVWSKEETDLLIKLNERYKHLKQPNVALKEYFPDKTLKQISDKRRLLPVQEPEDVATTDETGPPPSDSSEESIYESATEDEGGGDMQQTAPNDSWKEPFIQSIRTNHLEEEDSLRKVEEAIERMAMNEGVTEQEVGTLLEQFVDSLTQSPTTERKGSRRKSQKTTKRKTTHNNRKKFLYAKHQELYKKSPRRLLELALSGESSSGREVVNLPEADSVGPLYKSLWGQIGPEKPHKDQPMRNNIDMSEIWTPIALESLVEKFKKIKSDTAAGADQIKKFHLRKKGALHVFAKLCNLLMLHRIYPAQWKTNRTTLIPKPGKSAEEVENWRPITIGSLLGRIYSAMIDRKLRSKIKQHIRQKGFTQEDGCKNNIAILSSALTKMKEDSGGIITIIDISKAFDTVPHGEISQSLMNKGVPSPICEYIQKMYIGCKTIIYCRDKKTLPVDILRGVKQGDPLSPLLFNLIIDPIIGTLDETTEGIKLENENISVLAFADDLVLLAKDKETADKQNRLINEYLDDLKMKVSAEKCTTFEIKRQNKTWFLGDPQLTLGQQRIPYADPEAAIKYLGTNFNPWRGLCKTSIKEIIDAARTVKQLKLKPHQKINLIRTYLLPRYIHKLVANPPPLGTLDLIDKELKTIIKEILHLHPSTTDGLIYTDKSHGGLGIQRVANIVKLAKLKHSILMTRSEDNAVKIALNGQEGMVKRYATSIGLQWPCGIEEIEEMRKKLKRADTNKWKTLISQGQGIKEFFGDKTGNAWLYNPEMLRPSRYLDALKLRTNTYGTKAALHRAKRDIDINCRRCGVQVETLGHILGLCTHTKNKRIKRHDEICDLIAKNVSKEYVIFREPEVEVNGDRRKPDMVIKDHDKVYVVDVTVRYENNDSLNKAYKEKENKYKETAEIMRRDLKAKESRVLPVVIGSRGAVPRATIENLKVLGLQTKHALTASLIALRSSIEMANEFLDYDHTT